MFYDFGLDYALLTGVIRPNDLKGMTIEFLYKIIWLSFKDKIPNYSDVYYKAMQARG